MNTTINQIFFLFRIFSQFNSKRQESQTREFMYIKKFTVSVCEKYLERTKIKVKWNHMIRFSVNARLMINVMKWNLMPGNAIKCYFFLLLITNRSVSRRDVCIRFRGIFLSLRGRRKRRRRRWREILQVHDIIFSHLSFSLVTEANWSFNCIEFYARWYTYRSNIR